MTTEEVHECLVAFVKKFSLTKIPIITGVVSDVDESEYTCTLSVDEDTDGLKGIRLKLALDNTDNGIIMIPENNATAAVLILDNSEHDLVLLYASKYKEMRLNVEKLVFNKGLNKGLVLLEKNNRELKKLNDNINILKNAVTTGFTAQDSILSGIGSAANAAFNSLTATMKPQVLNDLENKKIIQ
jgi:PHD/YefM family antitoxin component YafN of YafNO toxin-antitoxin module